MILFIFFPQIVNCRAVLLPLLLQDLIHLRFRLCPYLIQPLLRPGLQILVKLVSLCLNLLLDLILLGFRMFSISDSFSIIESICPSIPAYLHIFILIL